MICIEIIDLLQQQIKYCVKNFSPQKIIDKGSFFVLLLSLSRFKREVHGLIVGLKLLSLKDKPLTCARYDGF
jgi:hypothetical protein